jgi:HlyD family secretion protein
MQKIWMFAALLFAAACSQRWHQGRCLWQFEADDLIVSAEGSGRILQFSAEEGTVLGAGDTVGVIDAEQLMLRREQLEASIRAVAAKSPAIQGATRRF